MNTKKTAKFEKNLLPEKLFCAHYIAFKFAHAEPENMWMTSKTQGEKR